MRITDTILVTLSLLTVLPLSGCVMVGGYRSGGGFFLWPGSIGLLVLILVVVFVLRRL